VAPDGVGGMFVCGDTLGSLGGPNAGGYDIVLARYDSEGERSWLRQLGTSAWDWPEGITADTSGGFYLTARTEGSLAGPNPQPGYPDVYLARFNSLGQPVWERQFGVARDDWPHAVTGDQSGGVYIVGSTYGSLAGPWHGEWDAFIARYDSGGTRLWIRQFGTAFSDEPKAAAPGPSGSVYVVGWTSGSLGGPHIGGGDVFVARYDSTGARLWVKQFGTSSNDYATAAVPDGQGGILAVGYINAYSTFIARYDESGNQIWFRQYGGQREARGAVSNGAGGALVSGVIYPTDGFVAEFDATGEEVYSASLPNVRAWKVGRTPSGEVLIAGRLPGPNEDGFVAKYRSTCYANCDGSSALPMLNVDDFTCFITRYAAGTALPHAEQVGHYANCDASTAAPALNVDDFTCFLNRFGAGCR
jgi:hypothetical protein